MWIESKSDNTYLFIKNDRMLARVYKEKPSSRRVSAGSKPPYAEYYNGTRFVSVKKIEGFDDNPFDYRLGSIMKDCLLCMKGGYYSDYDMQYAEKYCKAFELEQEKSIQEGFENLRTWTFEGLPNTLYYFDLSVFSHGYNEPILKFDLSKIDDDSKSSTCTFLRFKRKANNHYNFKWATDNSFDSLFSRMIEEAKADGYFMKDSKIPTVEEIRAKRNEVLKQMNLPIPFNDSVSTSHTVIFSDQF